MDNSKIVGDTIQLERETYNAFIKMKDAAEKDGIKIKLVSGFREIFTGNKQSGIINTKNSQKSFYWMVLQQLKK